MDPTKAAGILFVTDDGKALFLKRGDGGDYPGAWCFPGGHTEDGETAIQTAERETVEELGFLPDGERIELCRRIADNGHDGEGAEDLKTDFTTFIQRVPDEFAPELNGEHVGWAWSDIKQPPEPMHPGCAVALKMLDANELDIARLMSTGDLTSPQFYRNVALWAIRISGTRAAYRGGDIDEWCWRDPAHYLSPDALARCNGLPVIFEHPESSLLTSEEYSDRNVGSVFLPYVDGEELWGIAKIYDAPTIALLKTEQLSTSPGVTVSSATKFIQIDGGAKMLIEGEPLLFDHIAICEQGVWDKGGDPAGIISDNLADEALTMDEDEKKKAAAAAEQERKDAQAKRDARLDAMLDKFDAVCTKVDSLEEDKKAKADAEEGEDAKKEREAKDKKDAEDKEKAEKEDVARKDIDALRAKVDEMEGKIPADLTDEDAAEMADAQHKADAVYSQLGQSAPRPATGETPLAYRRRALKGLQSLSRTFADSDLKSFDPKTLKAVGETIYADALAFSNSPAAHTDAIRYVETRTAAGHTIRTPKGHISSFLNQFRGDSKAVVLKHPSQVARGF